MRNLSELIIVDEQASASNNRVDEIEAPIAPREAVTTVVRPPPLLPTFPGQVVQAGLVKEFMSSVIVGMAFGIFLGYVLKQTKTNV